MSRALRRCAAAPPLLAVALALAASASALAITDAAAAGETGVTVLDTRGVEPSVCPPVDAHDPYDLGGGCQPRLIETNVHVTLRTMVGDLDLGTCSYQHILRIDGSGRTYMELIQAFADGPQGCSDFEGCMVDDPQPWEGQIEVDRRGGLYNRVSACFDTCMGQFRGDLVLRLSRTRRGWRETVSDDQAGVSGLEVDGHWDFDFEGIEIRRNDGAASGDGPAAASPSGMPGLAPGAGPFALDPSTPFVLWSAGADMQGIGEAADPVPAAPPAAPISDIRPLAKLTLDFAGRSG